MQNPETARALARINAEAGPPHYDPCPACGDQHADRREELSCLDYHEPDPTRGMDEEQERWYADRVR